MHAVRCQNDSRRTSTPRLFLFNPPCIFLLHSQQQGGYHRSEMTNSPRKHFIHPQASHFTRDFFFYAYGERVCAARHQGRGSHHPSSPHFIFFSHENTLIGGPILGRTRATLPRYTQCVPCRVRSLYGFFGHISPRAPTSCISGPPLPRSPIRDEYIAWVG